MTYNKEVGEKLGILKINNNTYLIDKLSPELHKQLMNGKTLESALCKCLHAVGRYYEVGEFTFKELPDAYQIKVVK